MLVLTFAGHRTETPMSYFASAVRRALVKPRTANFETLQMPAGSWAVNEAIDAVSQPALAASRLAPPMFTLRNTSRRDWNSGAVARQRLRTGRGTVFETHPETICSPPFAHTTRTGSRMHHIGSASDIPREHGVAWLAAAIGLLCLPMCVQAAGRAYVSNEDGESVTVLDTQRAAVLATIPVGKRPRGLKLNRNGTLLYVAVSGLPKCPPSVPDEECAKLKRDLQADGVAVIDTATLKLTKLLKAGSDPEQFDLSRDGRRLFISNEDSAQVSVLDVANGAVDATIPVGHEPEGVRLSPNGRWVLVTSETDSSISIIDTSSLKVLKTVSVGMRPRDLAFTPDSATAYISGESDASLYRIAVPQGEPAARVLQLRKEARPMGVVFDAARNRVYVSTGRGGTVAVVALDGSKLVTEVAVGARPWGLALSPDGRRLYTANGSSNDVSIVDTSSLSVIKKIPVGHGPWGVVLAP
jgi:YVTN family beta-propeller protein